MNSNHCQLFTILIGFRTASPNNFCGGFALNAVLVDLGSDTYPIEVYMRIQDYQNKEIIEPKLPNFKCKINVRQ